MACARSKLPTVKPLGRINYDDHLNPLTNFCKQNELTKLNEDACYLDVRNNQSRKPFRWNTYNHHPFGSKVQSTCYPGQFYWDGYGIGGCNVDADSRVNRNPGYQATNLNVHQELPTLPVNLPRIRGYLNADTESNLRFEATFNKKECTRTTEKTFINNTFQIFDNLCYDPQVTKFIIPEETFNACFANAKHYHRAGEPTRFDRQRRYRNSCDWKAKNCPVKLNSSNFGY